MNYSDLYFYKGKYRTDEGLKRALIKDGIVDVEYGTFYLLEDVYEYYYPYYYLEDMVTDTGVCERKDFRKWLNTQIKDGKCQVLRKHHFYSSDYTDNLGTDWWDCRECVIDGMDIYNHKYPDDFIENAERTIEAYVDEVLTEEQFKEFLKLDEDKHFKLAKRWRVHMYNEDKLKLEKENQKEKVMQKLKDMKKLLNKEANKNENI